MTKEDEEAMVERRIKMEGRFVRIETKIDRLIEDWEKDKAEKIDISTALKVHNNEINERLTKIERQSYLAAGVIIAALAALHWIFRY